MDRSITWLAAALSAALLCGCAPSGRKGASKASADAAASSASSAPARDPRKVLITTLPAVPGKTLASTKGFNCRFFLWSGKGDYAREFEGALQAFRVEAAKHGADAIVNLRVSVVPFADPASKDAESVLNLCGDEADLR